MKRRGLRDFPTPTVSDAGASARFPVAEWWKQALEHEAWIHGLGGLLETCERTLTKAAQNLETEMRLPKANGIYDYWSSQQIWPDCID